jgi:UDP-N-acetylmuramate dehydrogenase
MTLSQPALAALQDAFGARLLLDEPLAKHTSARIGGPADAFLIAHSLDDLRRSAQIAWASDIPLFILGGGSNILISDGGVRGLVVHNQAERVTFDGLAVTAESGASTIHLARRCAERGLAGLEWAIGVPGTVGGAVYGNAGAHGGDMKAIVASVELVTPEGDLTLSNADLAFEYRSSILKLERRRCAILGVAMQLQPDDPAAIQARMREYTEYRKRTQPPGATIGSMFKNPPGDHAGRLIEAAGLKGRRVGGAEISAVHANFFLNAGYASAGDVKALADLAIREVKAKFGVTLELEIELVGQW